MMVRTGLAAMLALAAGMSVAGAQNMQPQVAVPAPGGGGGGGTRAYEGCYRVQGQIYGPYRMTFCLGRQQGYTVSGGGLDCRGGLRWEKRNPTRIQINLDESRCGRGSNWTADVIRCSFADNGRGGQGSGFNAQVAVPAPAGRDLSCRYIPKAQGFQPMTVTARRQS